MTQVTAWLVDNKTKKICISGHSGYAESGYDIVCSAVSTAVMLAGSILEEVCPDYIINTDEDNAVINIEINILNETANIVMKNLYLTLCEISSQYPKYLKVKINK